MHSFQPTFLGKQLINSSDQTVTSGQDSYTRSQCINYNSFRHSDSYSYLEAATYSILPSGIMNFDVATYEAIGRFEGLRPQLGLSDDDTFTLIDSRQSSFDESVIFNRYQQFHKGVEVENSGYTYRFSGGGTVEKTLVDYTM